MDVRVGSTLGQIGPKRYKYVPFSASQNVLKVIFKSPRFVLFGSNLPQFGATLTCQVQTTEISFLSVKPTAGMWWMLHFTADVGIKAEKM